MQLNELIDKASQGYPEDYLKQCWNPYSQSPRPGTSDTLALYLVRVVRDAFRPRASSATQVKTLVERLTQVRDRIDGVIKSLGEA